MIVCGCVSAGLNSSCDSAAKKEEAAQAQLQTATADLKTAQANSSAEAQKIADAEEWTSFKEANQNEIRANNTRIEVLRSHLKEPGIKHDKEYLKKVVDLEDRNRALQKRIDTYDAAHSDWAAFKREFSHDMSELGKSLEDFGVDNKK